MRDLCEAQNTIRRWVLKCFGVEVANDIVERGGRYLEESLELVQTTGITKEQAHEMVEYVYNRPVGERPEEAGASLITLLALCSAANIDLDVALHIEYHRIKSDEMIEKIRAKHASKPKYSILPGTYTDEQVAGDYSALRQIGLILADRLITVERDEIVTIRGIEDGYLIMMVPNHDLSYHKVSLNALGAFRRLGPQTRVWEQREQ